ncbi:hypothetical protein Tco_1176389 [Tanacetum coccineum]
MLPKFSQIVNRLYAFIYETNHSKSGLGLPSIVALVMVIDKSWTSLGKHEKAFYTGLKKFVDDCKPLVDSAGNIRCPCKSCRLVLWVSIKHLSDHISKYGFDPSYKTWIHHGEPDLPPPPPVIDNTRQPQMSDMTACLNDLSYIPLNNEQNEPTQGDIGETSNDPTQAKRNEFEELYASANEELYPGCDHVTRLDFMANFTTMYFYRLKDTSTPSVKLCKNGKTIKYQRRWKDSNTYRKKVPKKEFAFTLESFLDYKGVETIDIATGLKFNMRAMVLWTINGFPARSSLSGWSGQVLNRRVPAKFNRQEKENSSAGLGRRSYLLHRSSPPLDNDLGVSATGELFALAYGPTPIPISVNSCVVNGVRFSSMLHGVTAMTLAVRPYPTTPDTPDCRVAWATSFDMRPHMESDRWPHFYAAIQQHLQKIYNGMKVALKERYWIPDSDGTYDLESIRQTRPSHISKVDWDAQIAFWNDPKNLARLPK